MFVPCLVNVITQTKQVIYVLHSRLTIVTLALASYRIPVG